MDSLRLAISGEVMGWVQRPHFELVDGGRNGRVLEELVQRLHGEVAHSNPLALAVRKLLH